MIQGVTPWYEKGAPEPVYNVFPEAGAPAILWYGDCYSPEMIDMLKQAWPEQIDYVSLWGPYGFPLSLRQDIAQRVAGHKIVVFELAEEYRQHLSGMSVPEAPQTDTSSYTPVYIWQSNNFLKAWKPEAGTTLKIDADSLVVQAEDPEREAAFSTKASLRLEPSKEYYLKLQFSSPGVSGALVDFSTTLSSDYFGARQKGQFIYQGENTIGFDFPDKDITGTIRNIRIRLGASAASYKLSQIVIYAKP